MSAKMQALVWNYPAESPAEKLILLKMADVSDDDGCSIFCKMDTYATAGLVTRRGAQKILRRLESAGVVQIDFAASSGRAVNTYSLNIAMLKASAEPGVPVPARDDITGEGRGELSSPLGAAQGRTQFAGGANSVHPHKNPFLLDPLNPSLPSLEKPGPAPEFPEDRAAGEKGAEEPEPIVFADVKRTLDGLPAGVQAVRFGHEPVVSEGGKAEAAQARERLKALEEPPDLQVLCEAVVEQRAGLFARPEPDCLRREFTVDGWKLELGCFPLWAVREGFRAFKIDKPNRRPRAAEIAVRCRELVAPVAHAINACDRYLKLPLTEIDRQRTPEERAAILAGFKELRRTLSAPGPEPPRR
jgi:hypothetical protein